MIEKNPALYLENGKYEDICECLPEESGAGCSGKEFLGCGIMAGSMAIIWQREAPAK